MKLLTLLLAAFFLSSCSSKMLKSERMRREGVRNIATGAQAISPDIIYSVKMYNPSSKLQSPRISCIKSEAESSCRGSVVGCKPGIRLEFNVKARGKELKETIGSYLYERYDSVKSVREACMKDLKFFVNFHLDQKNYYKLKEFFPIFDQLWD